ncbi:MAG: potassium transporter TrkG, partial [Longimicrobiales bacterium]
MPDPTSILAALDRQVGRRAPIWQRATPAQLFVASFAFLVLLGTTLLMLLPGLYMGPRLSLIDALFTATSAICVTGLIVVDTATYFTPFGQVVLALLIQLGGLGILSFTTVIIVLLGRKMRLRSEQAVGPSDIIPEIDSGRLLIAIFKYTFILEFAGALLLWALWQ